MTTPTSTQEKTMTITELRNQPQQDRSTATLTRLTDAARHVADERGFDRLTTAMVAERAGLSIGTVYRYFTDRLAIINAIDPEYSITAEVTAERRRQNTKWGQQNHPDGTGPNTIPLGLIDSNSHRSLSRAFADDLAEAATQTTDKQATTGTVTWRDIILEETFEALAESDPVKLRTELIQVQAVAQQWVAAIDRRVI